MLQLIEKMLRTVWCVRLVERNGS